MHGPRPPPSLPLPSSLFYGLIIGRKGQSPFSQRDGPMKLSESMASRRRT